jgi:NADH-quinone oxidoreductase subunit M
MTGLALLLAFGVWFRFDPHGGLQFQERSAWIPTLGVEYFVGVDGLGLVMVLLTALIVPFSLVACPPRDENPRIYYALLLALESGLFGTFTALNFFHWFIFWELSLVPAFFLIKLWGGPQRGRAAIQFFVYTLVGSVAMLLAFQAIYLATGTFDFMVLAEWGRQGRLVPALGSQLGWNSPQIGWLVFGGVLLGLAVKVPLMPFHTWLPDAYAEAPTGTTMVLTGLMSKMGVYGFLRLVLPIFPQQLRSALTPLVCLALLTIIASAWAAMAQTDLKRTFAYSSINHLGYCLLGIFVAVRGGTDVGALAADKAAALNGVILQMFNHGLSAATLFCFIGWLEQRTGGLRGLNDFGGLRRIAPIFCGLMGIAIFSSVGLPGLNGFVSEFLIFKGTVGLAGWAAAAAVLGLLLTAIFMLTLLQRVFSGPLNNKWNQMADLTRTEQLVVLPAILLMFCLGIFPQLLLGVINPVVVRMIAQMPQ